MIICEIIVHLLVIVQNNKRCTIYSVKINKRALRFRRTESSSMATSVVWVMIMVIGFINTTVFRYNDIQRVYTRSSYTRKPFLYLSEATDISVWHFVYKAIRTATVTRCGSQEWQMLQVFHMTLSRYDTESAAIFHPFHTQWLLHIATPALTIKAFTLCLQNMFICHVSFSEWRAIIPQDKLYCSYFQCSGFIVKREVLSCFILSLKLFFSMK